MIKYCSFIKRKMSFLFILIWVCNVNSQEKRNLLGNLLINKPISTWEVTNFKLPHLENIKQELQNLPLNHQKKIIENAEKSKAFTWPSIPLTTYLDFKRNGNRTNMQEYYFDRLKEMRHLVLGELLEEKGRFLDAIINGSWAISEQSTWVLSAHLTSQKAGAGVPDVNEPIVDLAAGEIASLLGYVYYYFKDDFNAVSPLLSKRIVDEISNRIIVPYVERNDFWWQAFKNEKFVNNWNPWCNYNVVLSTFLLGNDIDANLRNQVVEKSMKSVDKFINYYKEDGACEEGPAYWTHAGGKMLEYLELVNNISNGNIYIGDHQLIKNMGTYIKEVHISDDYYVNFADSSVRNYIDVGLVYRYGKYIKDKELINFAVYLAKNVEVDVLLDKSLDKVIHTLSLYKTLKNSESSIVSKQSAHWFNKTEVAVARTKADNNDGFFFAAKGGYNSESHNHNDAGSFILYHQGKPLLIDVGVETYSAKTFSKDRYDIWTMQSDYHNLPKINGYSQSYGKQYKAKDVDFKENKNKVNFSLDIANTYANEAAVNFWKRSYTLHRGNSNQFIIKDSYQLKKYKGITEQVFMLSEAPEIIKKGKLLLKKDKINTVYLTYNAKLQDIEVQEIELKDPKLLKAWKKNKLYRIVLATKSKKLNGTLEYIISE